MMSDRMYELARKRILEGYDEDHPPSKERTTPQSAEECAHLTKRVASLEAIRDLQKRTIDMLHAENVRLREELKARSNG